VPIKLLTENYWQTISWFSWRRKRWDLCGIPSWSKAR